MEFAEAVVNECCICVPFRSAPHDPRRPEPVGLAVVACGSRLEETLTMLKSAVLFSQRQLHFHIFAEDDLHAGFRQAVSPNILNIYSLFMVFLWQHKN